MTGEQAMDKNQRQKKGKKLATKPEKKQLQRVGCMPAQTIDEIRKEMQEKYPGTTIEELEAMGC
jgi:ribosomal protein S25